MFFVLVDFFKGNIGGSLLSQHSDFDLLAG